MIISLNKAERISVRDWRYRTDTPHKPVRLPYRFFYGLLTHHIRY